MSQFAILYADRFTMAARVEWAPTRLLQNP
jgi:hypothetical protein